MPKWEWRGSYYWKDMGATYTPRDDTGQPVFRGEEPDEIVKEFKAKFPAEKSPFSEEMPDQIILTGMTEDMKFRVAAYNEKTLERILE